MTMRPASLSVPGIKQRLLVVDDNADSAWSLSMLLGMLGHEVRTANDGREAIRIAEEYRPNAMVLDIGLPAMNGYEVARHIRRQPWGRRVALIATTGWGDESARQSSRDAGFDHHLVKPVDHHALARLLTALATA